MNKRGGVFKMLVCDEGAVLGYMMNRSRPWGEGGWACFRFMFDEPESPHEERV